MKSRNQDINDIKEVLREIRHIYEETARLDIPRQCTGIAECCHFKITGRTPYLTKGEAVAAAKAWKATGRKLLPEKLDGSCPFLNDSEKCMIYESRPFGCRTHFCSAAGGPYARKDVIELIRRLEAIDHRLGGAGALPLQTAVEHSGIL